LWRQILADVFDTEIVTVNVTDGAAYGAALLAGVGADVCGGVSEACETMIQMPSRTQPGPAVPIYEDYHPRYRALYPALSPEFEAVAQVVGKHLTTGEEP